MPTPFDAVRVRSARFAGPWKHDHRHRQHGAGHRQPRARGGPRPDCRRQGLEESGGGRRRHRRSGLVKTAVTGDPIGGEVVVLAVYYPDARVAAEQYAEQYADQLAGKVVVDITNAVNETFDGLVVPPDSFATAELAALSWRRWPAERGS